MPTCSYYEGKGYNSYKVSSSNSSHYAKYVQLSRSRYNVLGDELQAAEEKVLRLRKQKKIWFEKMMHAVRCGIDSVEELEQVEREEAEAEQHQQEEVRPPSAGSNHLPVDFIGD
ncbi:hypothetical protein K456DRAFT_59059 [Colletotrichum gloeosporioides 23]|nr:hypothetical protein K456DRAFT_59059 [Colletotrichum gloeosporioides 23]